MTDISSDNNSQDNSDSTQEDLQDYLDLLLCQATEKPEAQVELNPQPTAQNPSTGVILEHRVRKRHYDKTGFPALTRVAETALSTRPYTNKNNHLPNKPFAEPRQPLALKLPIEKPAVKPLTEPLVRSLEPATVANKPALSTQPLSQGEVVAVPDIKPNSTSAGQVAESKERVTSDAGAFERTEVNENEPYQPSQWHDNGRPDWAQERFECLLFNVGGLTLAVPLVELGTIFPINEGLTPIFGQVDWFMGLLPVKDTNIRTVDSALVVMPERYNDRMKEHYKYVISINNVDWGLAVDSVSTAITLQPEEVRWRSIRSKRPWLAGTVKEHMCALLDISQLAALFVRSDGRGGRTIRTEFE